MGNAKAPNTKKTSKGGSSRRWEVVHNPGSQVHQVGHCYYAKH